MSSIRFAAYAPRSRQVITGGVVMVIDEASGFYRVSWPALGTAYDVDLVASGCSCRHHAHGQPCLHLLAARRAAAIIHGRNWRPWYEYKKQDITQPA